MISVAHLESLWEKVISSSLNKIHERRIFENFRSPLINLENLLVSLNSVRLKRLILRLICSYFYQLICQKDYSMLVSGSDVVEMSSYMFGSSVFGAIKLERCILTILFNSTARLVHTEEI